MHHFIFNKQQSHGMTLEIIYRMVMKFRDIEIRSMQEIIMLYQLFNMVAEEGFEPPTQGL